MPDHAAEESYVLPAVSSRRGVMQGLLVLTGIYAIALGLTETAFFGDAIGFSVAALVIVAGARFLRLEHPVMRLIVGMALFGPFLLGAIVTKDQAEAGNMALATVLILTAMFILLTPGKATIGVRGISISRLWKKRRISYDEIASAGRRVSRFGLIKGQLGFGSPTVSLTMFSGKKVGVGIAAEDVDRFVDELSQLVEQEDEDNVFFMATTAPEPATAAATEPKVRGLTVADPEPAAGPEPAAPRTQARGRRRGDAP